MVGVRENKGEGLGTTRGSTQCKAHTVNGVTFFVIAI